MISLGVLARPIPAILLLILPVAQGWSQPAFELFPGRKIFPLFTADGLQHTLSLTRVTENSDWIAAIGADVPFLQVTGSDVAVQAGIGVSTFNRLIKTPGHVTVYTVDYKVDLPLTLRRGPLALRICYGVDDHVTKREVVIGLDFNLGAFTTSNEDILLLQKTVNMFHIPAPAVKFTQDKKPRYYLFQLD